MHDVERIDHVALGLRHLVAVLVGDDRRQVDGAERHLPHEVQADHHHAGDPEEDDVGAGDEHVVRIERRRARASCSGQPSVENGHSADENQVSSTSSSWRTGACRTRRTAVGVLARDRDRRRTRRSTTPGCDGPTTAGARCTSPGCWSSSACTSSSTARGRTWSCRSRRPPRPSRRAARPSTHHCSISIGSITAPERWLRPRGTLYGLIVAEEPGRLEVRDHRLARLVDGHPDVLRRARARIIRPLRSITWRISRPARWLAS